MAADGRPVEQALVGLELCPPAIVLARRLDGAALLLRVFAIDVLECPRNQGRMRVLAFITDADAALRILQHLGVSTASPGSSRDPPVHRRASA